MRILKTLLLVITLFIINNLNAQSIFKSMTYKALPPASGTVNLPPVTTPSLADWEAQYRQNMRQKEANELYRKKLENEARALRIEESKLKKSTGKEIYSISDFRTFNKATGSFISSSFSPNSNLEFIDDKYLKINIPKLGLNEIYIVEDRFEMEDGIPAFKLSGGDNFFAVLNSDDENIVIALILAKSDKLYTLSITP